MESLFFPGLAVQMTALIFAILIKDRKKSLILSQVILIIGIIISFLPVLISLLPGHAGINISYNGMFRFDGLTKFFLFVIQIIAVPTSIYNISYFDHYIKKGHSAASSIVFFIILVVACQFIVISNHAIMFLISWEIMGTSAYGAMLFEKEKPDVQKGSFYYFVASHVLVFIMYIAFFLLHRESGSWFFTDFDLSGSESSIVAAIFLLSFAAFGIKAGFIPFHFWLPRAHPVAPTPLSAFLSGIIIKLGIYGIMRTILFLPSVSEWMGWFVLAVSMVSAIFGVWYALAQHDLKKLLAYHSIENIGIIGLGIGIGLIGSANNSIGIQVLGFGGALLHTLNHAIFKSLLFTGSGIIYQNLGTRNIESMGGIVHHSKFFALLFITGSVAISGIPPLNGFISEFIIFNGFFMISNELKNDYSLAMIVSVVGLALVGGLAVACFTKINSIMLLGSERKKIVSFKVSMAEYISLGFFAILCIFIGFYPQPVLWIINGVLEEGFLPAGKGTLFSIKWGYINLVCISLTAGVAVLFVLRRILKKKYGGRRSAAWGCGYDLLTPKMQYTASSYADELNIIPKALLVYCKKYQDHDSVFPVETGFHSHSDDFIDTKIVLPVYRKSVAIIAKFDYFSRSDVRYYVAFILGSIAIYTMVAFLWN